MRNLHRSQNFYATVVLARWDLTNEEKAATMEFILVDDLGRESSQAMRSAYDTDPSLRRGPEYHKHDAEHLSNIAGLKFNSKQQSY